MRAIKEGPGWLLFITLFWLVIVWSWIAVAQTLGFIGLWEPQDPGPFTMLASMWLALGCLLSACFWILREMQGRRATYYEGKMRMIP